MEDDLNLLEIARQPQSLASGRQPSIFYPIENGRQYKCFGKGKMNSIFWQMEEEEKQHKTLLGSKIVNI